MKITLIGTGQVGLVWARALVDVEGVELSLGDPVPSKGARTWAAAQGLEIGAAAPAMVEAADVVMLCVPGTVVEALAARIIPAVPRGAVIVDLSTAGAALKRHAAESAAVSGVGYIDIAITGAVGIHGVRTPLIHAGERDNRVEGLLEAVGAPVSFLSGARPGDAISVKLFRSVIMKGLEALAVEALPAAQHEGVLEALLESLSDVDRAPFRRLLESMATSHPKQAYRRYAEVLEARGQLESAGFPHALTDAVAERYAVAKIKAEGMGLPSDDTLGSALEWIGAGAEHVEARGTAAS